MRIRTAFATVLLAAVMVLLAASSMAGQTIQQSGPELAQATVTLTAVADATVKSWQPSTNFGGEDFLELSYSVIDVVREAATLLRFDVASALPADAIIDSATLQLFLMGGVGADPVGVAAYFVTSGWAEGSVTWNTFPTAEPVGIVSQVDASPGSYKSWNVTSFAQAWHSGSNDGLYLRGPVDGTTYGRTFESREHMESVPQLVLTYHLPCPSDPYEPNDSFGQATSINAGVEVSAYVCGSGDEDYFKFYAVADQEITIDLYGAGGGLPEDYNLELYNPAQGHVAGSTNSGTSAEQIIHTAEGTGYWYVRVYGYLGAYSAAEPYKLLVILGAPPTDTPTPTGNAGRQWVVNTTADHDDGRCEPLATGDCTLREAMRTANEQGGPDTVLFDIPTDDAGYEPGSGAWTITPASNLPAMADDGTKLDAITGVGVQGLAQARPLSLCSSPKIVIDAASLPVGFYLVSSGGQVKGFSITHSNGYGLWIQGVNATNNLVVCNQITDNGNGSSGAGGVRIAAGASNNHVGSRDQGNLISGNNGPGILIIGGDTADNHVEGNFIGTDVSGNGSYANSFHGLVVQGGHHNAISHNVIAANSYHGLHLTANAHHNEVQNNFIGAQAGGLEGLGNGLSGVAIDSGASDNVIGPDNTITSNVTGVQVDGAGSLRNTITWNVIYANSERAIDNTAGGNTELPPPTLSVVASAVTGSSDCFDCTVEIFADTATPAQAHHKVGVVQTDANGNWSWPSSPSTNEDYVASVTDRSGNTSELSTVDSAYYFQGSLCYFAVCSGISDAGFELVGSNTAIAAASAAEVLATAETQYDGTFTLAYRPRERTYNHYTVRLIDPAYTLTGAESGSGGRVTEGLAIRFTDFGPGVYGDNVFFARDFEEPAPEESRRSFSGHVYLGPPGDHSEPVAGVFLELYGSATGEEPGEPVAHTQTGLDGMFYLANRAPEGSHYPYYNLLLTHPGIEVTGVEPGAGGEAQGMTWIRFPLPDEWDSAGTKWYLDNQPEPVPPDGIGPIPDWSKKPDKVPDKPYVPQPIDFKVDGVELTQAIQCFDISAGDKNCPDNSLLLAAGKLTVARVYISRVGPQSADPQYPKVRVDLSIVNSGSTGSGAYTAAGIISQQFIMPLKWDRVDAKTTANFLIPAPMAGKLYASARVNVDNKWPDPNPNNNESAVTSAQVVDTLPVNIGWTRMRYKPAPPSTKYPKAPYKGKELADEWWVAKAAAPIKWLFPTAKVNYFKYGTGITDYYFELNQNGKLTKYTPDVRDDFVWYSTTYGVTTVFLKARLISMSSPSLTNLFAWFPEDAFYGHPLKGLAEGAPPVNPYGQGRVALSQQLHTHLLPHEVGHNFGLGHYNCFLNDPSTDHPWPAPYNKADCSPIEIPFNPVQMDVPGGSTFMTYNRNDENSISPPEWTYWINKLKTGSASSTAQKQTVQATPTLLISGWLNSQGQGELNPIYRLEDTPAPLEPPTATTAEILFLDSDGRPLGGHSFEPQFGDPYDASADFGAFQLQLPPPDGLDRVQLLYNGSLVAERQPSAHAPEVELLSPPPGSELDGLVPIIWQASDLDDDALTYALFYSHDGGTTWLPLGVNLTDPVYELDTQQVPGGEACFVKVLVSDGWHSGEAVGGPFSVARKPPAVTIDTPRTGVWKRPEQAVVLVGSAYDAEQGPLPDEVLAWRSDRDGLLGHGATLVLPGLTLERGEHVITLSAVDGDGQKGVDRVRIVIGHGLYLPIISKPSP